MKLLNLAATLSLALGALIARPAHAEIYGLIVGVDDYAFVPSLAGAVNDARDIAETLHARGAQVTLLLDAEATRERVVSEFMGIAQKAKAGDTIVFTYAGHGVQMPEALAGDESDGMDETFILHGFQMSGPGLSERIRDNDIADLLSSVSRDVTILMVADSCHSGTMTRSVDPRGSLGRSRFVAVGPMTQADTLPAPQVRTRSLEMADFPNVVYAHAATDEQQTPEVEIDGTYRGALSWSVARALGGKADGGDGTTSLGDFQTYVIEQVRALSGTRQTPGVDFDRSLNRGAADIFSLFSATKAAPPKPPETRLALAAAPTLFIRDRGESNRAVFLTSGVPLAASEETARLLWDKASSELVDRATADVIAEVGSATDVDRAILKWRSVQPLSRWAPERPVSFRLEPDDRRYKLGDELYITVTQPAPEFQFLTIVNLASTGEVQFVYPSAAHTSRDHDRIEPEQGAKRLGPIPVTVPTGADHVLALVSTTRLDGLHQELEALHGNLAADQLLTVLQRYASDATEVRVGLLPIFTER